MTADAHLTQHTTADRIGADHLGRTVTATSRATGLTVTGVLSDVTQEPDMGHTWLYAGGECIELRATDTVTVGSLRVLGGAA